MPSSPAQSADSNGLAGLATQAASSADPEASQAQRQRDPDIGVHDSFLQDALRLQQKNAARASKRVCMLTVPMSCSSCCKPLLPVPDPNHCPGARACPNQGECACSIAMSIRHQLGVPRLQEINALQASRSVKVNGFHNAEAPASLADQKAAGAAAHTEEKSSSTAVSDGPLPDSHPSISLKLKDEHGGRPVQQSSRSAAAHQTGHSKQNGLPSQQASQTIASSLEANSSFRDGCDPPARLRQPAEGSSDKQVGLLACISSTWPAMVS